MENNNPAVSSSLKVIVMGSACVIISSLTKEEIRTFLDFRPESLKMTDSDGFDLFCVDLDEEGPGALSASAAVFGATASADGKATITLVLDPTCPDMVDLIRKKLGLPLMYLRQIEEQLRAQLPEVEAARKELLDSIVTL